MVARQVLGALAGRDHVEPGAARPLDELAGEGGLVPVGHRVDHPGRVRFDREQRAGEHVRLDVHHDDVPARSERAASMTDARLGAAGGLHHHVDVGARHEGEGVVGEGGVRDEGVAPAGGAAGGPSAVRLEVRDGGDPKAGGRRGLGEEHRPELAGADEPDPHRIRCVGPLEKVRVEVHDSAKSVESGGARSLSQTRAERKGRASEDPVAMLPRAPSATVDSLAAAGGKRPARRQTPLSATGRPGTALRGPEDGAAAPAVVARWPGVVP